MLKHLRKIRLRPLISHIIVTLGYPAVKAFISESNRLLIFTDALTIVAIVLLIGGILYALVLHGDFDISGFVFKRGRREEVKQSFAEYMNEIKERRKEAFNYPLFLSIVYLIIAAIIAYCFL